MLGQKSCRTKVPEFFELLSRILPRILLRNFPEFSRIFRASFRGKRRPEKIHQKSPPFFNAKFPGKHEKICTNIFWRAGKVKRCVYVFFGSFLMGEKKHTNKTPPKIPRQSRQIFLGNKIPPKIPGQSREHFVCVCVFFYDVAELAFGCTYTYTSCCSAKELN